MVFDILQAIDSHGGRLDNVVAEVAYPGSSEEDIAIVFATRFAAAFGRLMAEPGLEFTADSFERLLAQHRWIDLIFSLSGYRNADSFISLIANDLGEGKLSFGGGNLLRLLAMLTMNSVINVDFDLFWGASRVASTVAFLNYISSRYVFSPRAFEFRERLLEWIPSRLAQVKLSTLMLARLPEVYMHCSYAFTARKHEIKRPLMEQMRRACLEAGVVESPAPLPQKRTERVTVVVIGEQLTPGHAVFRSHSRAVQSLRGRFNVVGVVYPDPAGTAVAEFFDESIAIPTGDFLGTVRALAAEITAREPALILYLGIGMVPVVLALASLRLAPIQCASFGHTATSMSPMIDYFALPEDFVASPECFSEKLLMLPKSAMPFASRTHTLGLRRSGNGPVRVAIVASTMKLNPVLFDAIARIATGAKTQAEFYFFPLAATGLPYFELLRIVRTKIPRATVYPQSAHERYIERLSQCHFFLSPFPYGNMNGVIEAFELGMPGICLDGAEAHGHADAALFARIGLPDELVAKSLDEYVAAAIRMIDDMTWRLRCRAAVRTANLDAAFFRGDTALFRSAIEDLIWPPAS